MSTTTYHVHAERANDRWHLHIDEIDEDIRARSLDEVESVARAHVSTLLQVPPHTIDIDTRIVLPDDAQGLLDRSNELLADSARERSEAAAAYRKAVRLLRSAGYTTAEIGRALHISKARVSQLAKI